MMAITKRAYDSPDKHNPSRIGRLILKTLSEEYEKVINHDEHDKRHQAKNGDSHKEYSYVTAMTVYDEIHLPTKRSVIEYQLSRFADQPHQVHTVKSRNIKNPNPNSFKLLKPRKTA